MFLKTSRYARVATDAVTLPDGRQTEALRLRRLQLPPSTTILVSQGDRLDVLADRQFSDGTKFWHIADANTALDARTLVERVLAPLKMPEA